MTVTTNTATTPNTAPQSEPGIRLRVTLEVLIYVGLALLALAPLMDSRSVPIWWRLAVAVAAVLVLGWLATALLWWRQRRRSVPESEPEPRSLSSKPDKPHEALRSLKRACRANDAGASKIALLQLAKNRWQQQPPASLGAIANLVNSTLADAIDELNRALYGRETFDWDGGRLLREAERWLESEPLSTDSPPSPIAPLYPQRNPADNAKL